MTRKREAVKLAQAKGKQLPRLVPLPSEGMWVRVGMCVGTWVGVCVADCYLVRQQGSWCLPLPPLPAIPCDKLEPLWARFVCF